MNRKLIQVCLRALWLLMIIHHLGALWFFYNHLHGILICKRADLSWLSLKRDWLLMVPIYGCVSQGPSRLWLVCVYSVSCHWCNNSVLAVILYWTIHTPFQYISFTVMLPQCYDIVAVPRAFFCCSATKQYKKKDQNVLGMKSYRGLAENYGKCTD